MRPHKVPRDCGNADTNIGHNLVFQGLYQPSFSAHSLRFFNGFELSTIPYKNSGFPINVIAGTDLNNDGVVNDRPLFAGRNAYTGRGFAQGGAQIKRYFDV